MSDPGEMKMYSFMLDGESSDRLDEIAQRVAEVMRLPRPNRSDALRRAILGFDVEAWAQRHGAAGREPAQAAA